MIPRSRISAWKPRFVITVTATRSTPRSSARIATIWSPSTSSPFSSTASIRSPSPSNAIPRSKPPSTTVRCRSARSVAPQPTLMLWPSGASPIACTSAPQRANASGARPEYEPLAQSTTMRSPVRSEPKRSRTCSRYESVAISTRSMRPWSIAGRRGEQRLDLLLGLVGELAALRVEELDAVVLGRVVRRRDDDAEVERQQRDRRRRQHAGEDAVAAGRDDAARERLLELDARRARVAADEDLVRAGPERGRAAEPLDELRRQELANDAADTIGAEVPPRHEAGG